MATDIANIAVQALLRLPPAKMTEVAIRLLVDIHLAEQDERTRRCVAA